VSEIILGNALRAGFGQGTGRTIDVKLALSRISLKFKVVNSSKNFTFVSPFFHMKSVCGTFTVDYTYLLLHLESVMRVFLDYTIKLIMWGNFTS